jgi:hypothetical protein
MELTHIELQNEFYGVVEDITDELNKVLSAMHEEE